MNGIFDQYLRTTKIPVLEYQITQEKLKFRWNNVVDGFDMPIKINTNKDTFIIKPTNEWQIITLKSDSITIDRNYYIEIKKIM